MRPTLNPALAHALWLAISLFCLLSSAGLALACGYYLLQIRETSGTLLGGLGSATALFLLLPALFALGLGWLLGLTGARWVWLLAFLLLTGMALHQWATYPDDHNGNLIFSPTRDELGTFSLIGGMTLLPLLLPCRRPRIPDRLRWLLAGTLSLLCLYGLLLVFQQIRLPNLPTCAFDKHSGQQLSICLDDEPPVLID